MGKKLAAVLLLCIVTVAAMHTAKVEATNIEEQFKDCYNTCHKECFNGDSNGYTFCEMKCDADCGIKEIKAKFDEFMS